MSTSNIASAVSTTFQTTIAAISIGLECASFTLSLAVSKFRTRSEIGVFTANGLANQKPASLTVPMYLPNSDQHLGLVRVDDEESRQADESKRQQGDPDRSLAGRGILDRTNQLQPGESGHRENDHQGDEAIGSAKRAFTDHRRLQLG